MLLNTRQHSDLFLHITHSLKHRIKLSVLVLHKRTEMVDGVGYFIHTTSLAHNPANDEVDTPKSPCEVFHMASMKDSSYAYPSCLYTYVYAFWLRFRHAIREISQWGAYQALPEESDAAVWRRQHQRSVCPAQRCRQNV